MSTKNATSGQTSAMSDHTSFASTASDKAGSELILSHPDYPELMFKSLKQSFSSWWELSENLYLWWLHLLTPLVNVS